MSSNVHDSASKRRAIEEACQSRDIESLIELANGEDGLLDDSLRATAWPLLLGCPAVESDHEATPLSELPEHRDEEQVQKDVDRAFIYYPPNEAEATVQKNKTALFNVIVKVLRQNPMLHYFQGYHDIVQVFFLVLGEEAAHSPVARMSLLRIRDYMLASIEPSIEHLRLIPAILQRADPELAIHLSKISPTFALSAVLTLYAHEMQKYADISRLYDFILAHEPVYAIYLFAALIISRRSQLLDIEAEDQDMLLLTLSKLPQPLDLQALIDKTLNLVRDWPSHNLPGNAWQRVSAYSVLKTSRADLQHQSLDDARVLFEKQSQQLARQQKITTAVNYVHKNRLPIIALGTTLLVGVLSYYVQRNGIEKLWEAAFWRVYVGENVKSRKFGF